MKERASRHTKAHTSSANQDIQTIKKCDPNTEACRSPSNDFSSVLDQTLGKLHEVIYLTKQYSPTVLTQVNMEWEI